MYQQARMESQLANTSDALDAIKVLYDTGKYADMKIRCEDKEEAAKGEYHMSDEKLPIVEAMINYLYCGNWIAVEPPKPVTEPIGDPWAQRRVEVKQHNYRGFGQQVQGAPLTKPSSLLFNAKVYIIADKYMIPALKSLAHENFTKSLREHWNTPEFAAVAEFLWDNTPGSDTLLRKAVTATAATYIDVLLDKEEFVDFMSEYGEFTVDVMKRMKGKDKSVAPAFGFAQNAMFGGNMGR
ncbi:BTB/POZ domain-containing protein [Botrytis cinerea]